MSKLAHAKASALFWQGWSDKITDRRDRILAENTAAMGLPLFKTPKEEKEPEKEPQKESQKEP